MRPSGLGVVALAMAISCSSPELVPSVAQAPGPGSGPTVSVTASAPTVPVAGSQGNVPQWEERFDFDGDAVPDRVELDFTGGAHFSRFSRFTAARARASGAFDVFVSSDVSASLAADRRLAGSRTLRQAIGAWR